MQAWKMRSNDVAVREILEERREAIESGKLKARRLFQSTMVEDESATPRREVRSICFYSSDEDESGGNKGVNDYSTLGCSSSSSSSLVDEDHHLKLLTHMVPILAELRVSTPRNGTTRYAVLLAAFAFVLLLLAMSISFARTSRAHDRHVTLLPT